MLLWSGDQAAKLFVMFIFAFMSEPQPEGQSGCEKSDYSVEEKVWDVKVLEWPACWH